MTNGFSNPDWYRQAWQLIREEAQDLLEDMQGNIVGGFNSIRRIRQYDCHGEWVVYVETALPAVAAALYLFIIPNIDEIIENYLNPKSGRGGSRRGRRSRRRWSGGNRGARRLFFSNAIPDIDEEIARRIPGGERIRGRRIGPGEHLFWTGIDVADRVLWYYLLTEAWDTFATTWQSEIQESESCKASGTASTQFSSFRRTVDQSGPCWDSPEDLEIAASVKIFPSDTGNLALEQNQLFTGWVTYEFEIRATESGELDPIEVEYTLLMLGTDEDGNQITVKTDFGILFVEAGGQGKIELTVEADLIRLRNIQFRYVRGDVIQPGITPEYGIAGRGSAAGNWFVDDD